MRNAIANHMVIVALWIRLVSQTQAGVRKSDAVSGIDHRTELIKNRIKVATAKKILCLDAIHI